MFIFLYGEDTYRSGLKLREIVDGYKKVHKTGLNLIYFDCQDSDFEEFQNFVQSVSMFQEKKLIILRNAFLNTIFKEKFLDWASPHSAEPAPPRCHSEGARATARATEESRSLARGAGGFFTEPVLSDSEVRVRSAQNDNAGAGSIIVVYENQALKKIDKLFKFLKSNAKIQEFNFFTGVKLQNWVDKEFEKYGARVDFAGRAKLIDFVGSDLWQMSQEIRKLCAYAGSSSSVILREPTGDRRISSADVQLLIIPKIETDIFKTIDAIALNNKSRALLLLHKHLAKGDAPLYLLSMINFQFRNLLVVKDYLTRPAEGAPASCHSERSEESRSLARDAGGFFTEPVLSDSEVRVRSVQNDRYIKIPGMHPYVVQKSLAQARNFTFDKLKKIYYKLLAIDTGIKTGKVEPRMALDMLIIGM